MNKNIACDILMALILIYEKSVESGHVMMMMTGIISNLFCPMEG